MDVIISFNELRDYIKNRLNKNLIFSKVSENEICVKYEQNIIIRTIQIPIKITVEEVRPDSITILYNGGFGVDMIITGILSFLKANSEELLEVLIPENGHRIRIELSSIRQTKNIMKYLELRSIQIDDNNIQISTSPKYIKMDSIILIEEIRDKKPWCLLYAEVRDSRLVITRIDFEEWERNHRNGQVEVSYIFDENNTKNFKTLIGNTENTGFLEILKKRFKGRSGFIVMDKIKSFCEAHSISYEYFVWY